MSAKTRGSGLLQKVRASLGGRANSDAPPEQVTIELARRDRRLLDEEEGEKKKDVPAASKELAASRTSSGKSSKSRRTVESVDQNLGGNNYLCYILGAVGLLISLVSISFFYFHKPNDEHKPGEKSGEEAQHHHMMAQKEKEEKEARKKQDEAEVGEEVHEVGEEAHEVGEEVHEVEEKMHVKLQALEGYWIVQKRLQECPVTPTTIKVENNEFSWQDKTWKFTLSEFGRVEAQTKDETMSVSENGSNASASDGAFTLHADKELLFAMGKKVDCGLKNRFVYKEGDWQKMISSEFGKMTQKINDDGDIENLYGDKVCEVDLDGSWFCSNGADATAWLTQAPDSPMGSSLLVYPLEYDYWHENPLCRGGEVMTAPLAGGSVRKITAAHEEEKLCDNLHLIKRDRSENIEMRFNEDYQGKNRWIKFNQETKNWRVGCKDNDLFDIRFHYDLEKEPKGQSETCDRSHTLFANPLRQLDPDHIYDEKWIYDTVHYKYDREIRVGRAYIRRTGSMLRLQDADMFTQRAMQVFDEVGKTMLRIEAVRPVQGPEEFAEHWQGIWTTDEGRVVKIDKNGIVHGAEQEADKKIQVSPLQWNGKSGKIIHMDRVEWENEGEATIVWERKTKRNDASWSCELPMEADLWDDNVLNKVNCEGPDINAPDKKLRLDTVLVMTRGVKSMSRLESSQMRVHEQKKSVPDQHKIFGESEEEESKTFGGFLFKTMKVLAEPERVLAYQGFFEEGTTECKAVVLPLSALKSMKSREDKEGMGLYLPIAGSYEPPRTTGKCKSFKSACEYVAAVRPVRSLYGKNGYGFSNKVRILFNAEEGHYATCGVAMIVEVGSVGYRYQTEGTPWPEKTAIWTVEF